MKDPVSPFPISHLHYSFTLLQVIILKHKIDSILKTSTTFHSSKESTQISYHGTKPLMVSFSACFFILPLLPLPWIHASLNLPSSQTFQVLHAFQWFSVSAAHKNYLDLLKIQLGQTRPMDIVSHGIFVGKMGKHEMDEIMWINT